MRWFFVRETLPDRISPGFVPPMVLELTVTDEDIWAGVRNEATKCPVAMAVRRALPPNQCVTAKAVHSSSIEPETGVINGVWADVYVEAADGRTYRYRGPKELADLIWEFDNGVVLRGRYQTVLRRDLFELGRDFGHRRDDHRGL